MINAKDFIDSLWEKILEDGDECRECRYLQCWEEHHPYGEGTASESLCECNAPGSHFCPGIQEVFDRATIAMHEQRKGPYAKGN